MNEKRRQVVGLWSELKSEGKAKTYGSEANAKRNYGRNSLKVSENLWMPLSPDFSIVRTSTATISSR